MWPGYIQIALLSSSIIIIVKLIVKRKTLSLKDFISCCFFFFEKVTLVFGWDRVSFHCHELHWKKKIRKHDERIYKPPLSFLQKLSLTIWYYKNFGKRSDEELSACALLLLIRATWLDVLSHINKLTKCLFWLFLDKYL